MKRQNLSPIQNSIAFDRRESALAPHQTQSAIARSSTHPIEELQGAIGNQAVNKLLADRPTVQTKPMFRGLSHELVIQPKLTIGAVGDKYEQEADRISQQVVDRIHAPQSQVIQREEMSKHDEELQPTIQRFAESSDGIAIPANLEASIQQARGGGQPLPKRVGKPMEEAMGADFSGVRVHTDARSDRLNRSIQAKAFTTGRDIFFRQGAYQPGSRGGQELIAHELTHVVQQKPNSIQRAIGLEYEITDWRCEDESTKEPLDKFHLIKESLSDGWELRADSIGSASVLEFQTKAKPKSKDMLEAVESMQEFAKAIQDEVQENNESIVNQVRIGSSNPERMEAHIQATMGVPLWLIPQLYETLSSQQDWFKGKASFERWHKKFKSKAPNGQKLSKLSRELQGFLLLLVDYQKQGYLSSQKKKVPKWSGGVPMLIGPIPNLVEKYKTRKLPSQRETATTNLTKDLYPLMLRTDFQKAFSLLPENDRNEITEMVETEDDFVVSMKEKWVTWIEKLALGDKKDLDDEVGQLLSMYKKGYKDNESGEVELTTLDLKRRDWLEAMPRQDLLAKKVGLGVGSYGDKTDVGVGDMEGEEALILELRDLRISGDRPEWYSLALSVAKIYDNVLKDLLFEVPSKKKSESDIILDV